MTIVLPHGVLFRGGEEGEIRKNLIERDHIDAIIGLLANIFFGTGIPTIVMVLKKQRTRSDVLIIDASKGYVKEGKNNKLRASDIRRIVDAYECREDIERFCRLVSKEEIRGNDYNLNIPGYVDSSEIIASNAEVVSYQGLFKERFSDFEQYLYDELIDEIDLVSRASEEDEITKEVFNRLSGLPLIDRYNAFQDLDDIWQEISIDLEILQTEGFDATKKVDPNMVVKKKQGKDVEVQDGWVGRVLPFSLVQDAFLTEEVSSLEKSEERLSAVTAEITEIFEGLSDEDKDAAGDAVGEDSFVSSKISAALKQLKDEDPSSASDEESILFRLTRVAALFNEEKILKKTIKDVRIELEKKTKEMIESLTDEQVCTLLDEKWIKPLVHRFEKLPDRVVNQLNDLVKALGEKYLTTYSDIDSQIQEAEASLATMLGELTGNEFDLAGLNELRSLVDFDER